MCIFHIILDTQISLWRPFVPCCCFTFHFLTLLLFHSTVKNGKTKNSNDFIQAAATVAELNQMNKGTNGIKLRLAKVYIKTHLHTHQSSGDSSRNVILNIHIFRDWISKLPALGIAHISDAKNGNRKKMSYTRSLSPFVREIHV